MKLPKEIQKKKKNKPRRPQKTAKRSGAQFGSRQMRRKMQQQGIDMDPIDATKVIIEGTEKTLIIEQPEVVLMKQAGQEIYQVIGTAEEYDSEEVKAGTLAQEEEEITPLEESEITPSITENDIMLVAAQASVDKEVAEAALKDNDGDIAKAILSLKNRP